MAESNINNGTPVNGNSSPVEKPMLRKIQTKSTNSLAMIVIAVVVVLAGIGTGWLLSGSSAKTKSPVEGTAPGAKETKSEAGIADESTFRDSAEGVLKKGGIDGEGTHHLERDNDPSRYVYLTSTVIDLQSFAGKKVKVWGETINAEKAGWLMDVGKIKVVK